MSIASELEILAGYAESLEDSLVDIRASLANKGVTATGHKISDVSGDIDSIQTGGGGGIPPDLPQDGKTRICYDIPEGTTGDGLIITLAFTHDTAATQTTVDWGDGSTETVSTGSGYKELTHTYSEAGKYIAAVKVDAGSITIGGSNTKTIYGVYNKNNAGIMRQSIRWIVVGDDVKISSYSFNYCTGLTNVEISNSVTSIGNYAFNYCTNLMDIDVPDSLVSIGNSVFYYCVSATSLKIPDSVTDIAPSAFSYCLGLKKVRFARSTPPTVSASSSFAGLPTTCVISVPVGSLSAYTSATNYPSSSTYTYIEEA